MNSIMTVKGLSCIFNSPKQLRSSFGKEGEESQALPEYSPQEVLPVDEYPACPTNWMHGSDLASSYFVAVEEGRGMWLDLNDNFNHTHDVAIVVSIQGINPVTGQKTIGEKVLRLEQYRQKCPIHDILFQQDYFCKECGYKWPGQNYIATTGTPWGYLWIDGFRTPDGKVRQYIITADEKRGVAAQLIGEDRVFAIGVAYYLSKDKKPETNSAGYCRETNAHTNHPQLFSPMHTPSSYDWRVRGSSRSMSANNTNNTMGSVSNANWTGDSIANTKFSCRAKGSYSGGPRGQSCGPILGLNNFQGLEPAGLTFGGDQNGDSANCVFDLPSIEGVSDVSAVTPVKQLEIGAGALIAQRVYPDPKRITYWEESPSGMIYINYCDKETYEKIIKAGKRGDKKDGFMQNLQVGG